MRLLHRWSLHADTCVRQMLSLSFCDPFVILQKRIDELADAEEGVMLADESEEGAIKCVTDCVTDCEHPDSPARFDAGTCTLPYLARAATSIVYFVFCACSNAGSASETVLSTLIARLRRSTLRRSER